MEYAIIKQTPSGRSAIIHKHMTLDTAREILGGIYKAYEAEGPESRDFDNSLSVDELSLTAYDGGDCVKYNIIETGE